jgi:UDP-2,3-diacylglucosamine pyrophosphatase LpxH
MEHKFLFISDLHLGSPLFRSEDQVFFLLNGNYDKIFIVGDIIDTWEEDVEYIVSKHSKLIDTINKLNNVIIIKGNHDPSLQSLESIFPGKQVLMEYEFYTGDEIGIIIHGDEFDIMVTKYSWISKILSPIHWVLERVGINIKAFFRELFYSIANKRNKSYYKDLVFDIEQSLVEKYGHKYKYVIVGHTHLPKIETINGCIYVNCGDLVHNKTYVIYEDGNFKLVGVI